MKNGIGGMKMKNNELIKKRRASMNWKKIIKGTQLKEYIIKSMFYGLKTFM